MKNKIFKNILKFLSFIFRKIITWITLFLSLINIFLSFKADLIINFLSNHNFCSITKDDYLEILILVQSILFFLQIFVTFIIDHNANQVKNQIKIMKNEEKKNMIDLIFTMLLKTFNIDNRTRITLFTPEYIDNKIVLKIFYRKEIGNEYPKYNESLYFEKDEGLPGKAWAEPIVLEKNLTIEDIRKKLKIHHLSSELNKTNKNEKEEKFADYFERNFDIKKNTFKKLSDLKYYIKSYFSIGFIDNELKKGGVIVIDSLQEEKFLDFSSTNDIILNARSVFGIITKKIQSVEKIDENNKDKYHEENQKSLMELHDISLNPGEVYYVLSTSLQLIYNILYKNMKEEVKNE